MRHQLESYGQRIVVQPIEEMRQLPLQFLAGSDPLEALLDIPLWTESEAPSDLVVRVRLYGANVGVAGADDYWMVRTELVGIRLEAPAVRGTPPPTPTRVVPSEPVPVVALTPDQYAGDFGPVPERWRPMIADVVHRLVEKDYVGLAEDGTYTGDPGPEGDAVGYYIERHGVTLRDLPEEAWGYSDHYQAYDDPTVWVVIVPLCSVEEGMSDLSLVGQVTEDGVSDPVFHVDIVEVL